MVVAYSVVQFEIFCNLGWHRLEDFTTKCILQEFIVYICLYLVVEVRDDDLLLQLLEEFPHLHISNHMMNKMWRQQLAQTEQLKAASGRAKLKLQNEVNILILTF